jgi:hypothetical protein
VSGADASAQEVLVVLDPNFGDRLRAAWRGQPVWVAMSPANAPVVHALWARAPRADHLTGITGFTHVAQKPVEDQFLAELGMIDLHHGAYSTTTPYTRLVVIGAQLTEGVRTALAELGFSTFQQRSDGFAASRSGAQEDPTKK